MQEKECGLCSERVWGDNPLNLDVTLGKVLKFLGFRFPIGEAGRIKLTS